MKGQPINTATRTELLALMEWIPRVYFLPDFGPRIERRLMETRENALLDKMDEMCLEMKQATGASWRIASDAWDRAYKALAAIQDAPEAIGGQAK